MIELSVGNLPENEIAIADSQICLSSVFLTID